MDDRSDFLPGLSPVAGKPVHAAFDGGRLTSDAGVLVLGEIERRLGIADLLAGYLCDPRDPARIRDSLADMIRYRMLAIAAGYPDANDCDSFASVPQRIVLDIDDTEDKVHGKQQLALFNAYHDSHCFQPVHIYEATTGKPVAVILRPGKTPDGAEVTLVLRHVVRAIRARWPRVDIVVRGDSHYARPLAMDWLERNRVGYIFGLATNKVLRARVADLAEEAAVERVAKDNGGEPEKARRFAAFDYSAGLWKRERHVVARVAEMATRIKVSLPTVFPYRDVLAMLTGRAAEIPP